MINWKREEVWAKKSIFSRKWVGRETGNRNFFGAAYREFLKMGWEEIDKRQMSSVTNLRKIHSASLTKSRTKGLGSKTKKKGKMNWVRGFSLGHFKLSWKCSAARQQATHCLQTDFILVVP